MTTAQNAHAHTAPVVRPHETTRPASTGAHHTNRSSAATWVDADYVGNPYCERCGTDEFIYLEAFVPAKHRPDGSVKKLGEVTYFCTGCDDFSAHSVPASWVPPGWYFG
jgi:hypothetical protein